MKILKKENAMKRAFVLIICMMITAIFVLHSKEGLTTNATAGKTLDKKEKPNNSLRLPTTSLNKEYEMVGKYEIEVGAITRMEIWVVPDNIFLSEYEAETIGREVIRAEFINRKFHPIDVFLVDDKRQIHRGYTIGRISYEPVGISEQMYSYGGFVYTYSFGSVHSNLMPRDYKAGSYPTTKELDVYFNYLHQLNNEEDMRNKHEINKDAVKRTALLMQLSIEEVESIARRSMDR